MKPPFLPRNVYTVRNSRHDKTSLPHIQQNYSDYTHECFRAISGCLLALERSRLLGTRHLRRTTRNTPLGVANAKVGVALYFRARFLFNGIPLGSATGKNSGVLSARVT